MLIPIILADKDVLLISATATGKTEAAMLPVLHKFLMLGGSQPGISIIYITPLRALNRDILDRMTYWANRLDIRLGVRHGDTSQKERNYQRRSPPDMLITTPETLQAILQGRTIKNHLKTVRWIIIDEIHELADNKRGSQLSIAIERIKVIAQEKPQLIGLSATIGTPKKVAKFLGGEEHEIEIVQISSLRDTRSASTTRSKKSSPSPLVSASISQASSFSMRFAAAIIPALLPYIETSLEPSAPFIHHQGGSNL